jgi:hypothetical protein
MKNAILVKTIKISGFPVPKEIYFLETPYRYNYFGEPRCVDFIYVSAADTFDHGPETMIFECDEQGHVLDWSDLVCLRYMNTVVAVNELGYDIITE